MVKKRAKPVRKKAAVKKKASKTTPKKAMARKKLSAKKKGLLPRRIEEATMEKVGKVTHYFPHVKAAAVKILKDSLKPGDQICIKGHTTDFKEKIRSLQLDRVPIKEGRKGEEVGLLVKSRVRIGDSVYRI